MLWQMVSSITDSFDSALNRWAVDIADPKPGEHLLDIGAGVGPSSLVAAHRGVQVTALEPSRFMRAGLSLRNRIANGPVRVVAGSVENIPLQNEVVDVAIAVNSFHHWQDRSKGLAEIHRVMKPAGRLYLVEEDFDSEQHSMSEAMNRFFSSHQELAVDPLVAQDELAGAGFSSMDMRSETVADEPVRLFSARR
ncbi:MAG: class I SAM-dependent methyltransferase [Acidimicrobiia bacterium]|nr:class I SAM-dependent methyltransferase [Acidimicrobiia bacterium]